MAEFIQVINDINRMCDYFDASCHSADGGKCPLADILGWNCRSYMICHPAETQNAVVEWAKAHPAPIYPTWEDVLRQLGVIVGSETVFETYQRRISPEHAAMLGIEPIEKEE